MNKDTAATWLPLVQALADGKVLQYKKWGPGSSTHFIWKDSATLDTSLHPSWYRIKPVPREFYLVLNARGAVEFVETGEDAAKSWCAAGSNRTYIKVAEVL